MLKVQPLANYHVVNFSLIENIVLLAKLCRYICCTHKLCQSEISLATVLDLRYQTEFFTHYKVPNSFLGVNLLHVRCYAICYQLLHFMVMNITVCAILYRIGLVLLGSAESAMP